MDGFGIFVKNTLLDKKHHEQMGKAVWLYMWLLDKMTSISEEGVGKVLGGKPIKQSDFTNDLQLSRATYFRYVQQLEQSGYINTLRTPYGLVIEVNKASKIFGNKAKREYSKTSTPEYSKVSNHRRKSEYSVLKSEYSNKTIQLDNTVDNTKGFSNKKSKTQNATGNELNDSINSLGYAKAKARMDYIRQKPGQPFESWFADNEQVYLKKTAEVA